MERGLRVAGEGRGSSGGAVRAIFCGELGESAHATCGGITPLCGVTSRPFSLPVLPRASHWVL